MVRRPPRSTRTDTRFPYTTLFKAMGGEGRSFGPEYLIPSPFDLRLVLEIAPAVARAAMDSGVAPRPIEDFEAYRQNLQSFVFRSGLNMTTLFQRAQEDTTRVSYAAGAEEAGLRRARGGGG